MLRRFRLAPCAVVVLLLAGAGPLGAAGYKLGTPGPEDAPELVTPGPDPVIRIPAGHQHAASGCIGYLYFSRKTIRYEVVHPDHDKDHSFEEPVANLMVAKQWVFMMSAMPEAEFKFRDGRVFHFFRVKKKLIEATNEKAGWDDILPWDMLVDAATKFDTVLAQVQAQEAQVAAAVKAAAPAPPAPPPIDDSTAMDSAGLEVPPPAPWSRPVPASGSAAGSGRP